MRGWSRGGLERESHRGRAARPRQPTCALDRGCATRTTEHLCRGPHGVALLSTSSHSVSPCRRVTHCVGSRALGWVGGRRGGSAQLRQCTHIGGAHGVRVARTMWVAHPRALANRPSLGARMASRVDPWQHAGRLAVAPPALPGASCDSPVPARRKRAPEASWGVLAGLAAAGRGDDVRPGGTLDYMVAPTETTRLISGEGAIVLS